MRKALVVIATASIAVASARCDEPIDCFIKGSKNGGISPLECAYLTQGTVCSDGHAYEVKCPSSTQCMCLVDGQMVSAIPDSPDVCGPTATTTTIPDTQTRFPIVARRCGWNILVTVQPQCPPNDCSEAGAD